MAALFFPTPRLAVAIVQFHRSHRGAGTDISSVAAVFFLPPLPTTIHGGAHSLDAACMLCVAETTSVAAG